MTSDSIVEALSQRIRDAAQRGEALRLRGGGTKDFYGNAPRGVAFDTRICAGIVRYEPSELVVTARCGTGLSELEALLAEKGQCLPFEPPHFGPDATLGGCIAAGLSGPRRASAGSVRDFVLGVKMIDGRGRILAFGGEVMKNVAGYDVSRLLTGSLGIFGLIVEASLKVLPLPAEERTVALETTQADALQAMNRWAGEPLPISASAWRAGALRVRLSGSPVALGAAARKIGGEPVPDPEAASFWIGLREHADAFFSGPEPLWRIAVPSTSAPLELDGRVHVEWGGGLRWVKTRSDAGEVRAAARRSKGHATLFRADDKSAGSFTPLEPALFRLHRSLKAAFDPAGIFNPGRMYEGL